MLVFALRHSCLFPTPATFLFKGPQLSSSPPAEATTSSFKPIRVGDTCAGTRKAGPRSSALGSLLSLLQSHVPHALHGSAALLALPERQPEKPLERTTDRTVVLFRPLVAPQAKLSLQTKALGASWVEEGGHGMPFQISFQLDKED